MAGRPILDKFDPHAERVSVDLDGVLTISGGTGKGPEDIAPRRPGAQRFLKGLKDTGYEVVIHTARPAAAAKEWLRKEGLLKYVKSVSNIKQPSKVYVDDRAVEFRGDFDAAAKAIESFRPHWDEAEVGSGEREGREVVYQKGQSRSSRAPQEEE